MSSLVTNSTGDDAGRDGIPDQVWQSYAELSASESEGPVRVSKLSGGLLHETRAVETARGAYVLQRVSPVFSAAVQDNIQAVSAHLRARGVPALELLPTRAGEASVATPAHGRWRLMTRLPGVSFPVVQSLAQVQSAGALVGRFHAALEDFDAKLAPMGLPFRETERYLANLSEAIAASEAKGEAGHRCLAQVQHARREVESALARIGPPPEPGSVPERVIHGDLKISNLLFESSEAPGRDRASALIDFDTLMRAPLHSEWGDAWRSWCQNRGEDEAPDSVDFDLDIFAASVRGFAEGYPTTLAPREVDSLILAPERMILELCVRFLTDVLEESYFAWDASRFGSAADHNWQRFENQWALFEAAWAKRNARAEILHSVLG